MDKMSLTYDGLTIETEFDSELQILHFIMEQQLNEHAELVVSYLVRGPGIILKKLQGMNMGIQKAE